MTQLDRYNVDTWISMRLAFIKEDGENALSALNECNYRNVMMYAVAMEESVSAMKEYLREYREDAIRG